MDIRDIYKEGFYKLIDNKIYYCPIGIDIDNILYLVEDHNNLQFPLYGWKYYDNYDQVKIDYPEIRTFYIDESGIYHNL